MVEKFSSTTHFYFVLGRRRVVWTDARTGEALTEAQIEEKQFLKKS